MPIEFACQVCKQQIRVPDGNEGKRTKCPHCSAVQPIPGGPPPAGNVFSDSPSGSSYGGAPQDASNPYSQTSPSQPQGEANPYASPYTSANAGRPGPGGFEAAQAKLRIPAIVCMSLLGIMLVLMVLGLVMNVIVLAAGPNQRDPAEVVGNLVGSGIVLIFNVFTLFALYNASQLRTYALAWAGFILALLPCSSGLCCIFVMPFAIWGMVVLSDAEVQRQFQG